MVWIHGGGFQAGAGPEPRHDGEALARKGVVVVTINYRLGVFGFLAHPGADEGVRAATRRATTACSIRSPRCSGSRRTSPPSAATRGNVTIFGESAGSFAVSALMASPAAAGLFHRAIGESGAYFTAGGGTLALQPLAATEQQGVKFAAAIGATSLAALRGKSADELLAAAMKTQPWFSAEHRRLRPARGRLQDLRGRQAGARAAARRLERGRSAWRRRARQAEADGSKLHRRCDSKRFGEQADAIIKAYPAATDAEALESAAALASDSFIGHATWKWIEMQAQTGGAPVYRYSFDRKIPVAPDTKVNGVAGDVEGHWRAGMPARSNTFSGRWTTIAGVTWEPSDRRLSDAMVTYWANFARTGDPNGSGLPAWPRYEAATRSVLHLDETIHAAPDSLRPRYEALEAFVAKQRIP